jgi:ribonuclease J
MTRDFVAKAKEVKPIALIAEGTRIADPEREESEDLVYSESGKIVSSSEGMVFADFNFKDVDRMRTFFKIAKETGRKFVVKINDAYFLKYLSLDAHLSVPSIDDENIIIYLPKRGSGTYDDKDYRGKDKEFLDLHNTWTAEQIASRPNKVLCAMGFYSFTALIDMKLKSGATYIHSASEPHTEEEGISEDRKNAWLDKFGMSKFQSHCSGHARGKDLFNVVSEIGAKTLYPIHTEHPDLYKKVSENVVLISEGKKYNLS